jgi:hypothetical protein
VENDLGMREEKGLCRNVGRDREEEVRVVQGLAGEDQGHDTARES